MLHGRKAGAEGLINNKLKMNFISAVKEINK
jgi:hypothetical protein